MADKRELIVRRAAQELRDGYYVNLGIGMRHWWPIMFRRDGSGSAIGERDVRIGPFPVAGTEDADLINAGKRQLLSYGHVVLFECRFVCDDPRRAY